MAAIIIQPLPDWVLVRLFNQAIIGRQKGEPFLDGLRCYTRLIEAELQGQVLATAHYRELGQRKPPAHGSDPSRWRSSKEQPA